MASILFHYISLPKVLRQVLPRFFGICAAAISESFDTLWDRMVVGGSPLPLFNRLSAAALTVAWGATGLSTRSTTDAEFSAGQFTNCDDSGETPESRRTFSTQRALETRLLDPC